MNNILKISAVLGLLAVNPISASAAEQGEFDSKLTGGWGGSRQKLADKGVDVEAVYKLDVFGNVSGGIKEGTRVLDNLDVVVNLDGEKLIGAKGTTAFVQFLNNNGGRPDGDLVGSAQGINNIETPQATGKLYQAWLQQNFYDDRISILGGLYDLNSEFYITDSSLLFIHSTYGIGTDIAQSGINGPSIFPFTSLAARLRVRPTNDSYIQAAVLDGVPGDPNNPSGTQIELNDNDGALLVAEAGYNPEGLKVAVGGWRYTERFATHRDVDANGNTVNKHSQGAYILAEKKVYLEAQSKDEGLTVFGRLGFADESVNLFDYAWSAGMVYVGLVPGREGGALGLAMSGVHNSGDFMESQRALGANFDDAETAIELTYSDNLLPWLNIQPDVQYIVNPGTDPALDNAFVVGTRFAVQF